MVAQHTPHVCENGEYPLRHPVLYSNRISKSIQLQVEEAIGLEFDENEKEEKDEDINDMDEYDDYDNYDDDEAFSSATFNFEALTEISTEDSSSRTLSSSLQPSASPSRCWWLCIRWRRYRRDLVWLILYGLVNAVAFTWRFLLYPKDPLLGYWPAIAKGNAQLILINTMCVLLCVCRRLFEKIRTSKWFRYLSVYTPMEKHISLHRLAGFIVMIASLVHSIAWIVILWMARSCSLEMWSSSNFSPRLDLIRTLPLSTLLWTKLPMWTGILMVVCIFVAFPFTLKCTRTNRFDAFVIVHMVLLPFLLLVLIHGVERWTSFPQAWYWIGISFCVYLYERVNRRLKDQALHVTLLKYQLTGNTMILHLAKPPHFQQRLSPGMFAYLKVHEVSHLEWHPFSVCSAPEDNEIRLHIARIGDWTRALYIKLQYQHMKPLSFDLEGPIGAPCQLSKWYPVLILTATGIGVTPFLSILRHYLYQWRHEIAGDSTKEKTKRSPPKIYLVWTSRKPEHFDWLLDTVQEFQDVLLHPRMKHQMEFHLHLTSASASTGGCTLVGGGGVSAIGGEAPVLTKEKVQESYLLKSWIESTIILRTNIQWHTGRPDWKAFLLETMYKNPSTERMGVFVCGSKVFQKKLKLAAAEAVEIQRKNHTKKQHLEVFTEIF